MLFAELLTHTCTIRRASVADNELGEPIRTYSNLATEVACRFVEKQEAIRQTEIAERLAVTVYLLFLLPTQDIREDDQITGITYEDGSTEAGTYTVEELLKRRTVQTNHHQTVKLQKVS